MSIAEWDVGAMSAEVADLPVTVELETRPMHRIREVRKQQNVSPRTVARRMGTSIEVVQAQEQADADLTLSDLYRWQCALGVPVADLLVDLDAPLSTPVLQRSRLLKIMKTVRSIHDEAKSKAVERMAETLAEQLTEIMPELREVSPWHSVGQRRTLDELGRVAEQTYSDCMFYDAVG